MLEEQFSYRNAEGFQIFYYRWSPEAADVRGVVQIAHGMGETAARYERVARELCRQGLRVYANDHRGHGHTAVGVNDLGYIGEEDGFDGMVRDLKQLGDIICEENPDTPVFLLGHSMGSFLAQKFMALYGDSLSGVILSGSNGPADPQTMEQGMFVAKSEVEANGPKAKSQLLTGMLFGGFNQSFAPARTDFDWLSRDESEVDKYIADPYCGSVFPSSFFYHLFQGLAALHEPELVARIPKDLPVYIFSGDKDPVGNFGEGVLQLYESYKQLGIQDVECKLYPDGRHEMLNEINRDEVTRDLIEWLNRHIAS